MSTNNPRDTQFQGFAILLMKEIDEQVGAVTAWGIKHDIDEQAKIGAELYSRWRTVIARRAYDLVQHACEAVNDKEQEYAARITAEAMLDAIPDLTELPKVDEEDEKQ